MAFFNTLDAVRISATQKTAASGIKIWEIRYPDGEVRECHPELFDSQFKKGK